MWCHLKTDFDIVKDAQEKTKANTAILLITDISKKWWKYGIKYLLLSSVFIVFLIFFDWKINLFLILINEKNENTEEKVHYKM